VAAGALSLFGLLITLLLLRLRYTHDSWEPPTAQWTKTRGVVSHHTQRTVVGADGLEHEIGGFLVHYEFRTTRGEVEGTLVVGDTAPYSHGREFDVYYQPSNPDYHEIQDFVRDPDDVMVRLFDPAVHHTPE
jgi:hypothetical protein